MFLFLDYWVTGKALYRHRVNTRKVHVHEVSPCTFYIYIRIDAPINRSPPVSTKIFENSMCGRCVGMWNLDL